MAGKVVKQLAGSGTGQSFSDIMMAMKYTLSGSVVAKVICKATTEEVMAPKKKHLSYLVHCTFEPRLSIPDFSNLLINRTQHNNLVVAFKALLTIHHLMQYGSERFSQYIASNSCHFYVSCLHDRNNGQALGMNVFIRPYAKYLDEKATSYREVAFDFCRLKRGKDDGDMRSMPQDKLFKLIPVIEKLLNALLLFNATSNELSNPVVRVGHLFLYRDLIRLYAVYNESMINLIGRFFSMSKRDCRTALGFYKNFVKQLDAMNAFVKIAESIEPMESLPIGDPSNNLFEPVPSSVLEAFEHHLIQLESNKHVEKHAMDKNTCSVQSSPSKNETSKHQQSENISMKSDQNGVPPLQFVLTEEERRKIVEEERVRLEMFVSTARKQDATFSNQDLSMSPDENSLNLVSSNDWFPINVSSGDQTHNLKTTHKSSSVSCDVTLNKGSESSWIPHSTIQVQADQNLLDFNDFTTKNMDTSSSLVLKQTSDINSSPSPFCPLKQSVFHSNNPFISVIPVTQQSQCSPPVKMNSIEDHNLAQNQCSVAGIQFDLLNSPVQSGEPMKQEPRVSDSLDEKLAQLANSLSVRTGLLSINNSGPLFRKPYNNLTSVNWHSTSSCVRRAANTYAFHPMISTNQLPSRTCHPFNPWSSVSQAQTGPIISTNLSVANGSFISTTTKDQCDLRPTNPFL